MDAQPPYAPYMFYTCALLVRSNMCMFTEHTYHPFPGSVQVRKSRVWQVRVLA